MSKNTTLDKNLQNLLEDPTLKLKLRGIIEQSCTENMHNTLKYLNDIGKEFERKMTTLHAKGDPTKWTLPQQQALVEFYDNVKKATQDYLEKRVKQDLKQDASLGKLVEHFKNNIENYTDLAQKFHGYHDDMLLAGNPAAKLIFKNILESSKYNFSNEAKTAAQEDIKWSEGNDLSGNDKLQVQLFLHKIPSADKILLEQILKKVGVDVSRFEDYVSQGGDYFKSTGNDLDEVLGIPLTGEDTNYDM